MQKFNWFVASDNPMYHEKKLHFILKATSSDQIIENDIRKNMRSKVILNNTPVDVLAWMTSHSTITLLLSSTVEEYATFGSALLRKNLESFFHLDVQHMYCKYGVCKICQAVFTGVVADASMVISPLNR